MTYKRSADFREEGSGIYDRVYAAERPELFFKATASRCAGPGQPIGRRRDSGFTATEPELAIVVGGGGAILGFTLANDVSAWDIERDNPLYLPQSKVYNGCFAFGPGDRDRRTRCAIPYALELTVPRGARRPRGVQRIGQHRASSSARSRSWSSGCGGPTTCPRGPSSPRAPASSSRWTRASRTGDVVTISCAEIGELRNPVVTV